VDVGAFVQSGQVLVRLDPRDATLRLQQAEALLQQAEAEAQRANVEAERNAQLVQSGDISRSSYDRLTAQVAVADASVAQARAQVASAQKAVDDTTVRAPFAGHVSARPVAVGEYVTTASKVATVVRIQPIKLNLQVPEADAARLRVGMAVRAQVSAHPKDVFTGAVAALNVALDPTSRTMSVEARFPNRDSRLAPGMFGTAELRLSTTERGLFVPRRAVVPTTDGESSGVYVIDGEKARLRVVHAGDEHDGAVRILSGLEPGASVVAGGLDRLFDGAPVRVSTGTAPGNIRCATRRLSSMLTMRAPLFSATALATFRALPSTEKSRSRMGNPPSMSRMAPPVRNRFTLSWLATLCTSATTRFWSPFKWLSSMNM